MMEDKIRESLETIEPEEGAKERMYANILKKAELQKAQEVEAAADVKEAGVQTEESSPVEEKIEAQENAPVEEEKESAKVIPLKKRRWQRYVGFAAAFVFIAVLAVSGIFNNIDVTDQPVEAPVGQEEGLATSNPIQYVDSSKDFKEIDINLKAPKGAENKQFIILGGEIAEIDFTLEGNGYMLMASYLEEDFSGMNGSVESTVTVDEDSDAVLEKFEFGSWRGTWNDGDVTYYLVSEGDVDESTMTEVMETVMDAQ